MRRPDPVARSALAAFRDAGRRARWHTAGRWALCPFPEIEALLPSSGRILDFGCGQGHFAAYLALRSPGRQVVGVDIDGYKVEVGTRAVARAGLGGRVDLSHVGEDWRPGPGEFDAVVANDVLYLLGVDAAGRSVDDLAAAIRPGGVAVIKDVGTTPRWKHRFTRAEELLAVRVLGITEGSTVEMLDERWVADRLERAGLTAEVHRLDRGYPYAHVAVVGRRSAPDYRSPT